MKNIKIISGHRVGSLKWFESKVWTAERTSYNGHYPDVIQLTTELGDRIVLAKTYAGFRVNRQISNVSRIGTALINGLQEWAEDNQDKLTTDDESS